MPGLSPHFVDLIQEAVLASFWRQEALRRFLRRSGVSEAALAHLTKDTTKRRYLDWLFPRIEASPNGESLLRSMANALVEQKSFPDLEAWEDSEAKKDRARLAVQALSQHLDAVRANAESEADKIRRRTEAETRRVRIQTHEARLADLKRRLDSELFALLGTSKGGYDFQVWFADLCALFEIQHKRPYRSEHREVDGSIAIDGTTYLLSLKFTTSAIGSPDIDDIQVKLGRVADNTMGIVVSMSGFNDSAVKAASGPGTKLLLLNHEHVYAILSTAIQPTELVRRVRERASRTGNSLLPFGDFSKT